MIDLIPRDYWEHNFGDMMSGLLVALAPRGQNDMLKIEGLGSCIPVRSGRVGLVAALRALELPRGAHVGVPLYCCPVVFKAIATAGCVPCFIDVEPGTFCMSGNDLREKSRRLDAVIAVHMFGNLCDMSGIRESAAGRPIIEDCAQALGSMIQGRLAGSFGDIAFFSFRSGKYLSVGEGGAVYANDQRLQTRLSNIARAMTEPTSAGECVHVSKSYVKSLLRSRPLYGIAGYHMWRYVNKNMNPSDISSVALGQVYLSDFNIIKKRLPLLDTVIARQRANADYYSMTLRLDSGMLCSEQPGTVANRYYYPVTFSSPEHRDFIADYLLGRQIDTMKYLDDVVNVAVKHYGYAGDCPAAERLSKRVLVIPSYYGLTNVDVQRIAQCLNVGWEEIAKKGCGASVK